MVKFNARLAGLAVAAIAIAAPAAALAQGNAEIPRAASTPGTPKNWVGPTYKIRAQAVVDRLMATHPELVSITIHALPKGQPADAFTMIAGSFPDRIGNASSPGDMISAKKGVSQVESKWGTPDYGKKVSIVLPLKDAAGKYLPVTIVIAFRQSPDSGKIDTDFLQPGLAIRDSIAKEFPTEAALYDRVN